MMTYIVARVTADSNMATAMVVCSLETRSDNTTLSHSRRPGADLGAIFLVNRVNGSAMVANPFTNRR